MVETVAKVAKPDISGRIRTNPDMASLLRTIKLPRKRLINLTLLSPERHVEKAKRLLHLYLNPKENGHSQDFTLKMHNAQSHLKAAIRQGDSSPDTLLLLGATYVYTGCWNEATKVFAEFEKNGDTLRQYYFGALMMHGLGVSYRNSKHISSVGYFMEAGKCEEFAKSIMNGTELPSVFIELLERKKSQ